ncbi:MAG: glutathione S-transferase family protein [Pseudomonadota bacterium]|nr:glutathione S-transferase family protein [Pseudomonadota bacterium]
MKLYYSPGSCALASHIALEESRTDYEAIRIDFGSAQQKSSEFLEVNPKGRVPALVTERGILTETPAILFFLAQSFPGVNMAPLEDPFALAEAQSFNSYLCATVHVAHAHRGRGERWAYEESSFKDMRRKVPESVSACFQLIEDTLIKGPWVLGDSYSMCDPYLYTVARWMEGDGVDINRFPKVKAQFDAIKARPAAARAIKAHFDGV